MAVSAELRRELLNLPPEEREALADALYDSLADDEEALDPAWVASWSAELDRRMADGGAPLVDAKDALAELRDELAAKRR